MRRFGGQSVFAKLRAGTRSWECQTRPYKRWKPLPGEPMRRQWPTFEMSDLVLDLDAEGAKGVRAFDPQLDGEPISTAAAKERELQPARERVAEFEREYAEYESNFKSISRDRFHPLHITNVDLLALALFDSPALPKTAPKASTDDKRASYADTLKLVLDQNGVPHSIRADTSNTLTYMLFRRQSVPSWVAPEELLPLTLDKSLSFSQIERVVTKLIQAPEGAGRLSRVSDMLYGCLSAVPRTESVQLLSLLNHVLSNFEQRQLQISNKLYELCIWTSLRCNAIITAQHYFEKRIKNGSKDGVYDDDLTNSILIRILRNSISSNALSSRKFELSASSRLQGVFSLLTGYVPGEDQPMLSLRSLVNPEKPDGFRLYIQCLARLGAFRTIWHEWHKLDSPSDDTIVNIPQYPNSRKNGYFVTAILDALAKNYAMTNLAEFPGFTTVTGQFQEDCQLDMLIISRSADVLALPHKERRPHATATYAENWENIYQIFREKSIEKVLLALEAFLRSKPSLS
ncbi:hypothetical protein F5Y09DRAFT_320809 [Xylaria sp. FL1042]|nr:hypothetical protein F5Y09DRAFT_320809 [Xylaria sp. FL1042]